MDLKLASFSQISQAVKGKKVSALEVTQYFLQRANSLNPKVNAYIQINDKAEDEARLLDAKLARGEDLGLLSGVPFGIKDMFCTKGLRTTAASKMLQDFIPPYDSTVVARLKSAGATVLGKLNQDEFAMGSSNETSFFGPSKNPWNTDFVPGGSSGGSAAAQAARMAAGTLGTDTGGSIRQPASFCGVVGVKPSYGRVSRYGIIAFASSLDQAGPLVSCVEDAALSLEVICGRDPRDSTTSDHSVPAFSKNLKEDLKGMKVGLMKEYKVGKIHPDVQKTFEQAIDTVKKRGAEVVEVSVSMTDQAVPMYYLISASEASSNLARYDGVKYGYRTPMDSMAGMDLDEFYMKTRGEGFGREVKRRIMLGTYCLSSGYYDAYYNKACQVRRLMRDEYLEVFKKCDVILSPVTTSPAFKLGDRISDPLAMYLNDIFTVSTNLAGLPGMSVPFGMSAEGLPIGVQVTAAPFQEQNMLTVGFSLEQASNLKWKVPNV
jgi:aspartyl-tRNA(Asn)/glutamyl-tRNA(Gln) amidotransferase subunit A